ncbi:MAG: helix-turn-helix transcriptional regulator [Casimicrobiaceae bacterium]
MPIRLKALKPKETACEPRTLGEHIRKRRLGLKLTQKQAAERLSVNPWTVLNWETGRFEPPIRSLPAVFGFLGYDPYPPPTTLGERLLHVRRQHGWSTSEAARHLGVDRTTWQNWERGELILFHKHRIGVATLLGLDPKATADAMRARWNGKHRRWECPEIQGGRGGPTATQL